MNPSRLRFGNLALILLLVLVWGRAVSFEFTTWDDDVNVTRNPLLNPPIARSLGAIWTAPYSGLFIPVTYTLLAVESAASRWVGGAGAAADPRVFHGGNLLLHLACTCLVFRLLRRWVGADLPAWIGAAIFGVHPLQAESVAWVSETKGLLATLFALAAIDLHTGTARDRPMRVLGAMVCYLLAILSKPAAVAAPLAAFVVDFVLLRRPARSSALRLVPWLAIAALAALLTKSQQPDRLAGEVLPVFARPIVAVDALAFYLAKIVWPVSLGIDYGRTPARVLSSGAGSWTWIAPVAIAALLAVRRDRQLGAAALLVAAWLLPILGLVPFAQQYTSTVADRYVFAAMTGVALAAATWVARTGRSWRLVAGGALVAVLAATSFVQASRWRTSDALYRAALRVNPASAAAHGNLGSLLLAQGKLDESMAHFDAALASNPRHVPSLLGRGDVLSQTGRPDEAIATLEAALRLAPEFVPTSLHLADALVAAGREEEAVQQLTAAHELHPDDPDVNASLGAYYLSRGDFALAEPLLQRAVDVDPRFADAHVHLAACLWSRGDEDGALAHYRAALQADPQCFEAYRDAGKLLFNRGDHQGAAALWRRAAEIHPEDAEIRGYLDGAGGG